MPPKPKRFSSDLTTADLQEYTSKQADLMRSRVGLYVVVATLLYMFVSVQYTLRKLLFGMDTFRRDEVWFWGVLVLGAFISSSINFRSTSIGQSKTAAYVFSAFFLWAFSGLSVIYPESELVLVFYYGLALLMVSLIIPWSVRDILILTAVFSLACVISYDYVVNWIGYKVISLPRFYPPLDGLIFICLSATVSIIIRRKETKRDWQNFTLLKKNERQNAQIEKELAIARKVHQTLIPENLSDPRADVAVSYIPMGYVGGDYARYQFVGNRLSILMSDVTGHGVPAALLVNRVHAEYERLCLQDPEPALLLKRLNAFILRDFAGSNMYLSAICLLFDFDTHQMKYCNYGHPSQLFYSSKSKQIQKMESQSTLLGIEPFMQAPDSESIEFAPGDEALLFTDGVVDVTCDKNIAYGEERVEKVLLNQNLNSATMLNDVLIQEIKRHCSSKFEDDVFVMSVKIKQ